MISNLTADLLNRSKKLSHQNLFELEVRIVKNRILLLR